MEKQWANLPHNNIDWNKEENWENGIPGPEDDAVINKMTHVRIKSSVSCRSLILNLNNALRISHLYMEKGTLEIEEDFSMAMEALNPLVDETSPSLLRTYAHFYMMDGVCRIKNKFKVAGKGEATLHMSGGEIHVGDELRVASSADGIGKIDLHGGSIYCKDLAIKNGRIDLAGDGQLYIKGKQLDKIKEFVSSGKITVHGGLETVQYSYDEEMDGYTKVWGAKYIEKTKSTTLLGTDSICITYDFDNGIFDVFWEDKLRVSAAFSAAKINLSDSIETHYIASTDTDYCREITQECKDNVTVILSATNKPTMKQTFQIIDDNYLTMTVSITSTDGTDLSCGWLAPLIITNKNGLDIGKDTDPRVLCFPFGNNHKAEYRSLPMNSAETSFEVASFFDDSSGKGLITGAVSHANWKTGIQYSGRKTGSLDYLSVFCGATQRYFDVMPHGKLTGKTITSETIFVGYYNNWLWGMKKFMKENHTHQPSRDLTELPEHRQGVPIGWKSFGNYQPKEKNGRNLEYHKDVSDFIRDELPNYRDKNDSSWLYLGAGGLSSVGKSNLDDFVDYIHKNEEDPQLTGFYFQPFTKTISVDPEAYTESGEYKWKKLFLRDDNGNPIIDKNKRYILDPTHPGTLNRISYYAKDINGKKLSNGESFDFVRVDFMAGGSCEGNHHNKTVKTGVQAIHVGLTELKKQFPDVHLNAAISSTFPSYPYFHSRRFANDVGADTEDITYVLRNLGLAWWHTGLYPITDPGQADYAVVDGVVTQSKEFVQSQITSRIISGMLINTNNWADEVQQQFAKELFNIDAINKIPALRKSFQPLHYNRLGTANEIYYLNDDTDTYIALFNLESKEKKITLELSELGVENSEDYELVNLWTGYKRTPLSPDYVIEKSLNGYSCKLYKLTLKS